MQFPEQSVILVASETISNFEHASVYHAASASQYISRKFCMLDRLREQVEGLEKARNSKLGNHASATCPVPPSYGSSSILAVSGYDGTL